VDKILGSTPGGIGFGAVAAAFDRFFVPQTRTLPGRAEHKACRNVVGLRGACRRPARRAHFIKIV
jgi:hypothetical protein